MPLSKEIRSLLQSLVGITVSLARKNYGSSVALELGQLTLTPSKGWYVKLPEKRWISVKRGIVTLSDGSYTEEDGEEVHFELEEQTAARWGVPKAEPNPGRCAECAWFVRIDGNAYLLDYGVCLSSASPFDGRVVNIASGCPAFTSEEEA